LRVLAALVDGNSERATERMTGVDRKTIRRLAIAFGEGAQRLHNSIAANLSCSLVQVDEVWSFVGKKQARVTAEDAPGIGEAYTFTALDASSRFIISWRVGKRDEVTARAFMNDVRARLVVMPAMTSDGFAPYVNAIGAAFGPGIDYAQTVKNYSKRGRREGGSDHRYEPPRDPFITKRTVFGAPNLATASTAYMERQNATMRHHIGRMRRLCYAFSKRPENHCAAVALCYAHYNLCHVVSTLRVTPAMAAGLTPRVWSLDEFMNAILEAAPCETPAKQPLAPRIPETTSRELPAGRGFLRVVQGGKAAPVAPAPVPPPATPIAALATAPVAPTAAPVADANGQLSLLDWKAKPRQLTLWGDES
jgi:IS1 family transposase